MDSGAATVTLDELADGTSSSRAGVRSGALAPGEVLCERFRIVRFLGEGGMGQVFEAWDLELHASLALKVIRPELSRRASAVNRFKREVHLARRVTHPHVCRIFDLFRHHVSGGWGADGGRLLFLTMELLRGETLAERLHRAGPMSPREALPLIRHMADALDAAHRAGVIHRDFKSSNVLLVEEDDGIRGVVTDFGLARIHREIYHEEEPPAESSRGGTPAYMAPELFAGEEATAAADVYSFGVVVYEMTTGARPYATGPDGTADRQRLTHAPPSPRPTRQLDAAWERTIFRCLDPNPARRFTRASDVAAVLAGKRPARRHRDAGPAAVALAMAALLAVSLALTLLRPATEPPSEPTGAATGFESSRAETGVAVLGFVNLSEDPDAAWLGKAWAHMLTTELAASCRTIPEDAVDRLSRDLSISPNGFSEGSVLPRLRSALGVRYVVYGSYLTRASEDDGTVRMDVLVRDSASGDVVAGFAETGTVDALDELVPAAGRRLRQALGLGERPAGGETAAPGGPRYAHPAAARLHSQARLHLDRFEAERARELLERALEIEPDEPFILFALAEAWSILGYDGRAVDAARRALELTEALPRESRLWLEARCHRIAAEWPEAAERLNALWLLEPRNLEYGLALAAAAAAAGDFSRAEAVVAELRQRTPPDHAEPRIDLIASQAAAGLGNHTAAVAAARKAAGSAERLDAGLVEGRALRIAAASLHELGQVDDAERTLEQAGSLFASAGDRRSVATAGALLARWLQLRGDFDGARAEAESALAIFAAIGDRRGEGDALQVLGYDLFRLARFDEAEERFQRSIDVYREIGDRSGEADALKALAVARASHGAGGSRELFETALAIYREIGSPDRAAYVLNNLGRSAMWRGQIPEAISRLAEAEGICRELGLRDGLANVLFNLGHARLLAGEPVAALADFDEALSLFDQVGNTRMRAATLDGLSVTLLRSGRTAEARQRFEEGRVLTAEMGDPGRSLKAELAHARLLFAEERPDEALRVATKAVEEVDAVTRDPGFRADARGMLAQIQLGAGRPDAARETLEESGLPPTDATLNMNSCDHWITTALVLGATGEEDRARRMLEQVRAFAAEGGMERFRLAAEVGLAELDRPSPDSEAGWRRLLALREELDRRGLGLLMRRVDALVSAESSREP